MRFITTPVRVSAANDEERTIEFTALWDTGAKTTFISDKIIQECKLVPSGKTLHVSGGRAEPFETEMFIISVFLPNGVVVSPLRIGRVERLTKGDILLGMDIISLGDFAITNQNSQTIFTFCMPSTHSLDFLAENGPSESSK